MSDAPDLLTIAQTCLAASSASTDEAIAVFYLARARVALTALVDELRQVEIVMAAREAALSRSVRPTQLSIEPAVAKGS